MNSRTEITVYVDSEVSNCTDRMNICASDDDRRVGKLRQPAGCRYMSDTINTFKNRLDSHWKHRDFFYFIIVQPTPEPEIIIMFEYVKINECLLKMWT